MWKGGGTLRTFIGHYCFSRIESVHQVFPGSFKTIKGRKSEIREVGMVTRGKVEDKYKYHRAGCGGLCFRSIVAFLDTILHFLSK